GPAEVQRLPPAARTQPRVPRRGGRGGRQARGDTMSETAEPTTVHAACAEPGAAGQVRVNPAAFDELLPAAGDASAPAARDARGNLDLILDVNVDVTASLGNVRKSIGEILSLTEGQVVDMERGAGEPVDLLVNGRLVARGEVVVADERYGIRITEILAKAPVPAS